MAEGFEPYHVPQQSRRDKLRVVNIPTYNHHQSVDPTTTNNLQGCSGLLPIYDQSFIAPDLLTCVPHHAFFPPNLQPLAPFDAIKQNPTCIVKEQGVNLMGSAAGVASSTTTNSTCHYNHNNNLEDHGSSAMNLDPTSLTTSFVHDMNNHPFFYSAPNTRPFDYNGHQSSAVAAVADQGLSLSLSSDQSHHRSSNSLPLELNFQRYIVDVEKGSVPLGPFTGYASILNGSRFLKPGQQLLEEICDLGHEFFAPKMVPDSSLLDPLLESLSGSAVVEDSLSCSDEGVQKRTKSRLISMLEEVCRRYKLYYQQLQTVVSSFESVAGLSKAAPFKDLAFKTVSKHFRCLRNAITEQLQFVSKAPLSNLSSKKDGIIRSDGYVRGGVYDRRLLDHQPAWRTQRGLPERAVSVLRAWLFNHFLHPYPTDTDKLMLAKQTGLSRSQVSNWFINARVRLWKPMVEEIHEIKMRQAQKAPSHGEEFDATQPNKHLPSFNFTQSDNSSISALKHQDPPFQRLGNNLPDLPGLSTEHMRCLPYTHSPRTVGGGGSVSLTLGLHENCRIGLSETLPIATHRYSLNGDDGNPGCVMGEFGAMDRDFGRGVIGGQFLHDFGC
ncbi:hypothetical protein Nepgr_031909 [Nepenthes gracilis]|uniref:Homeobox domain-containing protein n=1 Tax=Nepenthes gracilis TaxID=150966 RepID=A0AAD3TJC6_NEPGR|nr:hypothetical protein Nepgr_031909 [Nepenthes gracilis]